MRKHLKFELTSLLVDIPKTLFNVINLIIKYIGAILRINISQ